MYEAKKPLVPGIVAAKERGVMRLMILVYQRAMASYITTVADTAYNHACTMVCAFKRNE
jgi:hypothetical protein